MLNVLDGHVLPFSRGSLLLTLLQWQNEEGQRQLVLHLVLCNQRVGAHHRREHEGNSACSLGDGAVAWAVLSARFDGNTKEARRECREKLFTAVMKPSDDPADFLGTTDDLRLRLKDTGEEFPDESYDNMVLQTVPKDNDFARQTSRRDRTFGLAEIRSTAVTLYIDELSALSAPPISGRDEAISAASDSDQCSHCKDYGHYSTLEVPHKIVTAGQHACGVAKDTIHNTVNYVIGHKRLVVFPAVVVAGLRRNLFSAAAPSNMGVVAIFYSVRPCLQVENVVLPMPRLENYLTL